MKIINKSELRKLISQGITTEDLNSGYDYSGIENMSWLCDGFNKIESIPFLDTRNVWDMTGMFWGCGNLREIPLLDTRNVLEMRGMFWGCGNLREIPLLDTRNVLEMREMFDGCKNLREIDPGNFPLYDFTELDNKFLREKFPEYFI